MSAAAFVNIQITEAHGQIINKLGQLKALNKLLKKSLLNRVFKNFKCKEQKMFKVAAYLGYVRV